MERSLLLLWWRHPSYTSSLDPKIFKIARYLHFRLQSSIISLFEICQNNFFSFALICQNNFHTSNFHWSWIPWSSGIFTRGRKKKKCCQIKTFNIQIERKCLKVKVGSISTKKGPAPEAGTSNQISPSKLDQI